MASKRQIKSAARTRSQIAQTFAALSDARLSPADVLADPPACLRRIRVYDVLRRLPHMGRDGAENVCRHSKVWPLKTMGSLTPEERRALIAHLPARAKKPAA